jgi:parvulin-like peptidyl-prolyl isomerase
MGCEKLPWVTSNGSNQVTPGAAPGAATQASTVSPSRPTVPPSEIVAKVNATLISTRDVELAIQEMRATTEALGRVWTPLSAEERAEEYDLHDLLDDLVIAELRTQDALARGLDRQTDLQYLFWYRYRTLFAQEWVRWQLDRLTVSQAEIDQYYQTYQRGFREPEQIRVRQLVLSSEDQAKTALVKLLEGVEFVTLSQQVSVRPEAAQGPFVEQWVMRSEEKATFAPADLQVRDLRDPVLEQAAFAIDQVGGMSSYVKGADGNFHVFQLVERRPGRQRLLVEVSDNIRNFLRLQKLSDLTEELRTKAKGTSDQFPERLQGVEQ